MDGGNAASTQEQALRPPWMAGMQQARRSKRCPVGSSSASLLLTVLATDTDQAMYFFTEELTMTPEELKALKKQAAKAKRIATEKAGELHDLVEDRLPAGYEDLPAMAEACYAACQAWAQANEAYLAAEAKETVTE
jgi:hypothetical protein